MINRESFVTILIYATTIFLAILTFNLLVAETNNQVVSKLCCDDAASCSDTYYSMKDNLCHLSLCEHLGVFVNNCTYLPNNITIIGLNGE